MVVSYLSKSMLYESVLSNMAPTNTNSQAD